MEVVFLISALLLGALFGGLLTYHLYWRRVNKYKDGELEYIVRAYLNEVDKPVRDYSLIHIYTEWMREIIKGE